MLEDRACAGPECDIAAFDKRMAGRDQEIADLMANPAKLEGESDKLLAAHFADAIDLPTLKRHQDRIPAGLADVNQKLAEHDEHHTGGRAFLHDSLRLRTDAHHAYARSGDADRRLANQAFYTRIDVTDDEQLRPRLAEPFATIVREAHEHSDDEGEGAEHEHDSSSHVACSRKTLLVVLARQFSNSSPSALVRAVRAYRRLDLTGPRPVRPAQPRSKRLIRLTAEQRQQLAVRYQHGATVYELAAAFQIHRVTVARHLKAQGVTLRGQSSTEEQIDEMVRLYEAGLPMARVGEQVGFGATSVLQRLRERGVSTRDCHGR